MGERKAGKERTRGKEESEREGRNEGKEEKTEINRKKTGGKDGENERKKEKNRRNKHLIKDVKSVDQNRNKKTIR